MPRSPLMMAQATVASTIAGSIQSVAVDIIVSM